MLKALQELAATWQATIVAEGVETAEEGPRRCVARDAWRHEPAGSASLRNAMTSQPATGSPEIALLDLEKRFKEVCAVDGVSLEIAAGEFFSLLDAAPA